MGFQYDPAKAAANARKHGVSFADAEGVFYDPFASEIADPDAVDEDRFVRIGESSVGIILVVVYTMRGEDVRLISARRATPHEVREYEDGKRT